MAKIETPRPIRGTQSMIGPDAERFEYVVDTFNRVRKRYGFRRIEMPVFEATAVFARSLGETTDVVSKEMYTFNDRGGDSLTLRPEFTAGIARAYLTEGWQQYAPLKVATHGPLFRYERPQKGRFRQFHQLDAEVIGAVEPEADVELLAFADELLRELKIDDGVTLQLNTLGGSHSRDLWREGLIEHFAQHHRALSAESLTRLERNPLRILDSKDAADQVVIASAPSIDEYLTDFDRNYFEVVKQRLNIAGIRWTRSARLVRGLDYYRHTAFEFVTDRLGAQGTVLGGGRYDGLIETLGGPPTPAVGWAAGIERLAMLLNQPSRRDRTSPVFSVILEDDADRKDAAYVTRKLREAGYEVRNAFGGKAKRQAELARRNEVDAMVYVRSAAHGADRINVSASRETQFDHGKLDLDVLAVLPGVWHLSGDVDRPDL